MLPVVFCLQQRTRPCPTTEQRANARQCHPNFAGGGNDRSNDDRPTILGQQLPNPYHVTVMTEAYNLLYEPDVPSLNPTHLYLRFLPRNAEEAAVLFQTEFELFDVPLDYNIEQPGTYYQDPSLNNPNLAWFYTVVPAKTTLPAHIQTEVLAPLVLAPYQSWLTLKAHKLVNAPYNSNWANALKKPCTEDCLYYPDCLTDNTIPCNDEEPDFPGTPPAGGGTNTPITPPCDPLDENSTFPDCLMVSPPPGASTPAPPPDNLCQCPLNGNPKKPSGRVQVQDTQIGNTGCMEPVRRVKIVVMDNLFQWHTTYTDDNGCFKSDHTATGGLFFKSRMWVSFTNSRATIRGLRNANIFDYSHPVRDWVVPFDNTQPLNNLQIVYGTSANKYSKAKMYWTAAHANNAVHEWHDYAALSGINAPPHDLKILCTPFSGGSGAAPMFHQIFGGYLPLIGAYVGGQMATVGIQISAYVAFLFPELAAPAQLASNASLSIPLITTYFTSFLPDVIMSIGENNQESDQVKSHHYHELAHAVHYRQVGNGYWIPHIAYTIQHTGYGDGTAPNAGRVEVVETWANHIETVLADWKYGLNHSSADDIDSPTASDIERLRHLYALESEKFYNEFHDFIPYAIFRDLVDDNNLNPSGVEEYDDPEQGGPVIDVCKGFTNLQLYQALTSDVQSMPQFKEKLSTLVPDLAGNTQTDYDVLFNSYGY
ncbi:MAG TPA: hypothetical protein PK239_12355 [Chitinophagales bacterium]|nr:hypothetical protein [Chitinophagales bacterium]HRK28064.1 hypothetical protein [Chitinophagales bacterium]